MKEFDLAAAKKGARVCTMDGAHSVFIDFSNETTAYQGAMAYPLLGYILDNGSGTFKTAYFTEEGVCKSSFSTGNFNLVMADDDYLEKLERGEYGNATIEAPVWQEARIMTPEDTAKVTFLSPFDESYWRKQYAGLAMQGLCAANGTMKPASMVADVAVEYADALIEELKKEKEHENEQREHDK